MKQAQLGIHFHWLFILLIGVVIVAFFFTVISTNQQQAEAEAAYHFKQVMDTTLVSAAANPEETRTVDVNNLDITFMCEDDGFINYQIGELPVESTKYDILFTPTTIRGSTILSWTKTWHAPFPAATFTYLADDRTQFIFIKEDSGTIEELYEEFPDIFAKTLTEDLATAFKEGYERYVVISLTDQDIPTSYARKTYERIIAPTSIAFIHRGQATRPYHSQEELWGAIFTEDEQTFDCTMKKAQFQLATNAKVLKGRADLLATTTTGICAQYATIASNLMQNLINGQLSAAQTLEQLQMEQKKDNPLCPRIY